MGINPGERAGGTEPGHPAWGMADLGVHPRDRMLLVGGEGSLCGPGDPAAVPQLRVLVRALV